MKFIGVIPARYDSQRFPGKPLSLIKGQSMITRVYRGAFQCDQISEVWVATDDTRIFSHCQSQDIPVVMTSKDHKSGTDRVAEVALAKDADVFINIQGDEPFLPVTHIEKLIAAFSNETVEIATLAAPISDDEDRSNPNVVKVVKRMDGRALYFSRSTVPFNRGEIHPIQYWQHLGVYAYRRSTLLRLTSLKVSALEAAERLEQLRWLESGFDVQVCHVEEGTIGIDTAADVGRVLLWMEKMGIP